MASLPIFDFTPNTWVVLDTKYVPKWNNTLLGMNQMQNSMNEFGEAVTQELAEGVDAANEAANTATEKAGEASDFADAAAQSALEAQAAAAGDVIDDDSVGKLTTWSSEKISSELEERDLPSLEGNAGKRLTVNQAETAVAWEPDLDATRFFFCAVDEKPAGTGAGASIAGDQTRILNTVRNNNIPGASLSSNRIKLPSGKYSVSAESSCFSTNRTRLMLKNATNNSFDVLGLDFSFTNVPGSTSFSGVIEVSVPSDFEIVQFIATSNTQGLGLSVNDGRPEIYTEIKIEKVA